MAVTLTQLSAFLAVVRTGSVTAAAEELVVTQPSVSAAVAALERELGVELTERAGRGIKPTAAGEAYARYASDVVALLREGSEAAAEAARGVTDRVRVAAVTTAGEYLLPALIRGFREHRPDLDVSVTWTTARRCSAARRARGRTWPSPGGRPRTAASRGRRSSRTSSC